MITCLIRSSSLELAPVVCANAVPEPPRQFREKRSQFFCGTNFGWRSPAANHGSCSVFREARSLRPACSRCRPIRADKTYERTPANDKTIRLSLQVQKTANDPKIYD